MSDEKEPRFWVDDQMLAEPLKGDVDPRTDWLGVVDEERGGIVAYFGQEEDAEEYARFRTLKDGPYVSMHTIAGVVQDLLHYDPETPCASALWLPADVLSIAKDMTDDEVADVLGDVERYKDASLGITWGTIEFWADDVMGKRCSTCGWERGFETPEDVWGHMPNPDQHLECPTCHAKRPTYESLGGTAAFLSQSECYRNPDAPCDEGYDCEEDDE